MDCNTLQSFLSKQVRNMTVDIGEPYLKKCYVNFTYVNSHGTLEWEKIEKILCVSENFSIHDQQSTWFIDKINKLWPIFMEIHYLLNHSPQRLFSTHELHEWTSHPKEIEEYFELFLSSDVSTTEAILFLTAVLERSLGNLILLKGKKVPSLLRDLLSTSEIQFILGKVPVVFLQLLVGTPLALNLRNVVWHGFPRADELYPHFVSTLFVVILSIGELLLQRKIDFLAIPKRSQMQFSDNMLSDPFLRVQEYHEEILKLLFLTDFVPTSHYPYWKSALEYYNCGRNGRSLLLLLPQVEHLLRCLYCSVNNCSERALTAESVTLYTTLNEIMAENIIKEDGMLEENKLITFLGESVIEMLQDLFVHQAGPRLRDKMSHGECNLKDIPEQLVNQLIFVTLVIIIKSSKYLQNETTEQEDTSVVTLKNSIHVACGNYLSKFHPSSLLKLSIRQCLSSLDMWFSYYGTAEVTNEMEINDAGSERTELSSLIKQIYSSLQNNGSLSCNEILPAYVQSLKVQTMFRHKSENELLNILSQIMHNIEQICKQVMQSLEEKFNLFSQHLLRSRQRDTFQRMLCFIPKLKDILYCVTCIVIICLQSVNTVYSLSTNEFKSLTKFCHTILQFVQNVVSLTKRDKNRWVEIEILSEKVCHNILRNLSSWCFSRFVLL